MHEPTSQAALTEYRDVLSRVQSRASVVHGAHAVVVGLTGLVVGAAALRLGIDLSTAHLGWAYGVGAGAALLFGYALLRALLARRARRDERRHLERLEALRRSLGLDEPSAFWATPLGPRRELRS